MTGGWVEVICCGPVWKMASNRAENYQLYFLIVKVLNKQGPNHFQNPDKIISSFCGRELALRPQTSLRKSWQIPIEDCCHPGLNILRTSPDDDDDDDDDYEEEEDVFSHPCSKSAEHAQRYNPIVKVFGLDHHIVCISQFLIRRSSWFKSSIKPQFWKGFSGILAMIWILQVEN